MPQWLRTLADVFPLAHISGALHQAFAYDGFGATIAPADLFVIALWGVAATFVAARCFDWLPART